MSNNENNFKNRSEYDSHLFTEFQAKHAIKTKCKYLSDDETQNRFNVHFTWDTCLVDRLRAFDTSEFEASYEEFERVYASCVIESILGQPSDFAHRIVESGHNENGFWFDRQTCENYRYLIQPGISNVVDTLKSEKGQRQAIIVMRPDTCLTSIQFFIEEDDTLSAVANFRSSDALKGIPTDIALLKEIQSLVAKKLDKKPGTLATNHASYHLYNDDIKEMYKANKLLEPLTKKQRDIIDLAMKANSDYLENLTEDEDGI